MSKLDIQQIAKQIIEAIGGEGNIVSAAHCATRLRIVLKDDSLVQTEVIEQIDGVKGSFNNGGQFQIILGTGLVNQVYQEFVAQTNISEVDKEELKEIASSEYCGQIEPPVRCLEPVSARYGATQCGRKGH